MAPGRDLRDRAAKWGGSHEPLRGADNGGGISCGPGQFGRPARVEHLPGCDGSGVCVEKSLRDHGCGLPHRLNLFRGKHSHPFGVWPELADLGGRVAITAEQGVQIRATLVHRRIKQGSRAVLVRSAGSARSRLHSTAAAAGTMPHNRSAVRVTFDYRPCRRPARY